MGQQRNRISGCPFTRRVLERRGEAPHWRTCDPVPCIALAPDPLLKNLCHSISSNPRFVVNHILTPFRRHVDNR